MPRIEVPVLIVGAGPAGLVTALLLRRLGVRALVVERRGGPQRAPAAHVVNARTLEICRQAGVDMDAIAAAATAPANGGTTHWVTKLGGDVIGSLPFERQDDEVLAFTPTPLRNLSQHRFEPILLAALRGAEGELPRYGHRWESGRDDADGVTSSISDSESGHVYDVRSRYLIGADGAGSPVRKWLGIEQTGPERLQSFVMVHFAADLRRLVGNCPGVLYWIADPDCSGTFVAHDIASEWVFMHSWDSDREPAASFDAARCEGLVRRAMARDDIELQIRSISTWVLSCQVADRYRQGNAFLVGDAAHRFPPTGGMGLNTGVQDAHNLAWKLAAVLAGRASDALLDTYQGERRPVAQYNAEQSLLNAMRLFEVPAALGFDPDPQLARRNFSERLGDATRRRAVETAIANQAEHFDMLGLQLGFAYESGALLGDGSERPVPANPVREFVPSSRPGARLPHGWLTQRGHRCSTLDLIPLDRLTLLVGERGDGWQSAAEAIAPALHCVRIGRDVVDADDWWHAVAEMDDGGALLVRPDQHVAFRARTAVADPVAALHAAIAAAWCGAAR